MTSKHLIIVTLTVLIAFTISHADSPHDAFLSFVSAIEDRNGEEAWNFLSSRAQQFWHTMYLIAEGLTEASPECEARLHGITDGKSYWMKLISEYSTAENYMNKEYGNVVVLEEKISGDKAMLKVKVGNKTEMVEMIREVGRWKLDLSEKAPIEGKESTNQSDTKNQELK
jgi:hypothetical protein